jgi:type IV secretion/conjugal transfer VirB4 family ATPase
MMALHAYADATPRLCDFLPWAALVAPGVVLNKDGSLQRTARFRGPDLDSATPSELVATTARLNNALRRLGSGWAIFIEARRDPSSDYPISPFPDPLSRLVDRERREQFLEAGAHFESRYYLTFVWQPPAEDATRFGKLMIEGRAVGEVDAWAQTESFVQRTDRVLQLVDRFMPEAVWLGDDETLSFLHGAVSTTRQAVRTPETPIQLDALLATQPLVGGLEPRLGEQHLRVLSLTGFPTATFPGILDDLNRLGFAYRWTTRALMLDKTDAVRLLSRIRRQWFAKRKSVASILKEVMTNESSALVDNDAANKAADADAALQDLGADDVGQAFVTASVVVWDHDPKIAAEKLRLAEKAIQGRDFTVIVETVNAVDAWFGTLPGQVYANVRQPPISTINLAHMMPLSAVWAGTDGDGHLAGPPLFHARTDGSTPFRFSLHVGDVGHTLVVGPTGAGKSVLLAITALSFRRYAGAQIFAFDFGGSIRAAMLGMGGAFHDLGAAGAPSLQPLARIDDPAERTWAADWLTAQLARDGEAMTAELREALWSALGALATSPEDQRTLSGLIALVQDQRLKQALRPYALGGPAGRLLDGDHEDLEAGDLEAFETEGLIGSPGAAATLAYLFHRIEARLDGKPTLVIIDEGWLALDDAQFSSQLREWLKTLRKKNASVVFATQSLADIKDSPIAPAIIESCPTRIFLPNARALEPQIAAIYEGFGLNARQVEILARATPKRDYYCQSPAGDRLFDLGLGEVALAFAAAASKSDQAAITRVFAEHGPADFAKGWLLERGLDWAADLLTSQELP